MADGGGIAQYGMFLKRVTLVALKSGTKMGVRKRVC